MANIAFVVGNSTYRNLNNLECCIADVDAISDLVAATGKYDAVIDIKNATSSDLKARIREAANTYSNISELFFYFSGHGYFFEEEFFYCCTNFDQTRPNETGLSTSDLHTLLRMFKSDLVVKIADACSSGTHLIKSDLGLTPQNKQGFNNLIQISSCLNNQSSLTGHPLSLFTDKFMNAALSKADGVVHYMDIISSLRDQFIDNDGQIPFFVHQGTGREEFVDNARKFDRIRDARAAEEFARSASASTTTEALSPPRTLVDLLQEAESKIATSEKMESLVARLFDQIKLNVEKFDLIDIYELEFIEHDDFKEDTTERFITEVLFREKRPDNFVSAQISKTARRQNPFTRSIALSLSQMYDDEQFSEMYDLRLNCKMARTQLRVNMTPKFSALGRFSLVVTCAPSLENCYVFEFSQLHMMRDFGKYDSSGLVAAKRWYELKWNQNPSNLAMKISDTLLAKINEHIELTTKRLNEPE